MNYNKIDEQIFNKVLYSKSPLNADLAEKMLDSIKRESYLFSLLPGVRALAVCNSVAFSNPTDNSDIDLFIILRAERFFTYRFLITLFFHLKKLRRHSSFVRSRYCLSFFISDNNLNLSDLRIEDDVYFYYWFKNLIFLDTDYDFHSKFRLANSWFTDDLKFKSLPIYSKSKYSSVMEYILSFSFFRLIEVILEKLSLKRISSKNKKLQFPMGVIATKSVLKFHVKDIRKEISEEFYRLRSK